MSRPFTDDFDDLKSIWEGDLLRVNTFSIAGFDPVTGELGVAVASKFLAVGSLVPWAKAGVGAIATQSWVNSNYGIQGLKLLEKGMTPEEVLQQMVEEDSNREVRQVGIIDARGNSATYSGKDCYSWAGGIAGPNFACQGNILVGEETVQKMAEVFQIAAGTLADRLLQALLAGQEAGGDSRGKQSAAILVVKEAGGYGGYTDRYIDLRVDDHTDPIRELIRIHELHKLYFEPTSPADILKVEGAIRQNLVNMLIRLGYLKENLEVHDEELYEALKSFHLIENFDERILELGLVDRKVVKFMEGMTSKA